MAAARMLQRRILSVFSSSQPTSSLHRAAETSSGRLLPSVNQLRGGINFYSSGLKDLVQPINEQQEAVAPTGRSDSQSPETKLSTALSNLKTSSRHDLVMMFTCNVCETRSAKTTCRESYEKGVVVVKCSGCNNLHLIADRLGWFGEPGSIEDFLAARGEEIKQGSVDTLNLTLEDLAGSNHRSTVPQASDGLK